MTFILNILRRVLSLLRTKPVEKSLPAAAPNPPKPKLDLEIPMKDSRLWKGIVVHHSASPDGVNRDWDGIIKYHTSYRADFEIVSKEEFERRLAAHKGEVLEKPWRAVGYHMATEFVNGDPVFHWGRPLSMVGAHAGVAGVSNKYNEEFLGFVCIGNFDAISPDPKLWDFNLLVFRAFMEAFKISADNIIGHREVFDRLNVPRQKTCPGKCFSMDRLRGELRGQIWNQLASYLSSPSSFLL